VSRYVLSDTCSPVCPPFALSDVTPTVFSEVQTTRVRASVLKVAFAQILVQGQGESLVPPYTRGSVCLSLLDMTKCVKSKATPDPSL
jgi:hypothetical protein